jgi:hypothetical protein
MYTGKRAVSFDLRVVEGPGLRPNLQPRTPIMTYLRDEFRDNRLPGISCQASSFLSGGAPRRRLGWSSQPDSHLGIRSRLSGPMFSHDSIDSLQDFIVLIPVRND